MDLGNILPILFGIIAAIGVPLALRSRKKSGPKKVEELYHHLEGIGVKASVPEQGSNQEKVGQRRFGTQKPLGTISVTGRNIDSINVHGVASQYGVHYFLDYLVRISSFTGRVEKKKTKMIKKKTSALRGKVIDVEWRGDDSLARKLNFDYQLKDQLLRADLNAFKGSIVIYPELKYEYARIRTYYFLPTHDLFEATDIIAKHLKSEW